MREILNKTYLIIFSIFCGIVPFTDLGEAIPNILLGILVFVFPWVVKKVDWKVCTTLPFYILVLLVLIITIQSVILGTRGDLIFVNRLILILIIIILSIPINQKLVPIYAFLSGSSILLLVSSVKLLSLFIISGKVDMTVGEHVGSVLLGDRPYVGYIYVISFCLCLYISTIISKSKFLFYTAAIIFLVFIVIISARMSLLSVGIIILFYGFYTKNVKGFGLIILIASLFFVLMLTFNKSLKKRFFITNHDHKWEQLIKFEPRVFIWDCGYNIYLQNKSYLFGKGFVNINNQLRTCYSGRTDFINESQQDFFVRSNFNTHNQFLNFLISTGIPSFLLFMIFFAIWLKENIKNYYACILVCAIFLFCLVENVLSRQMGVELFALTFIFSSLISNNKEKLNINL